MLKSQPFTELIVIWGKVFTENVPIHPTKKSTNVDQCPMSLYSYIMHFGSIRYLQGITSPV